MAGSLVAGRVAHFWSPERTIRIGFLVMVCAAATNALHSSSSRYAIPWAVIPIMLCTFGIGSRIAGLTILTLDLCLPPGAVWPRRSSPPSSWPLFPSILVSWRLSSLGMLSSWHAES